MNYFIKLKSIFKNNLLNKKVFFINNRISKLNIIYILSIKKKNLLYKNIFFNKYKTIKNNFFINNDFFFFKKNKSNLKSGYSRSRPYCKNIVLFGTYLNILFIYETNVFYYNMSINVWYVSTINFIIISISSLYIFYKFFFKIKNKL